MAPAALASVAVLRAGVGAHVVVPQRWQNLPFARRRRQRRQTMRPKQGLVFLRRGGQRRQRRFAYLSLGRHHPHSLQTRKVPKLRVSPIKRGHVSGVRPGSCTFAFFATPSSSQSLHMDGHGSHSQDILHSKQTNLPSLRPLVVGCK